jgi:WD40 repeat protein
MSTRLISPEDLDWIDDIADQFESAWRGANPPAIADFVKTETGDRRLWLLEELVKIDLEYRWRAGDRRRLEDYLTEYPELLDCARTLLSELADHARRVQEGWPTPATASAASQTNTGAQHCPQCGNRVYTVAFSPDGRFLASGAGELEKPGGEVFLWDVRRPDGEKLRSFTGHRDCVNGVAFSPDGRRLATASDDKTVKLWEVTSGRLLETFPQEDKVWCAIFSPDGRWLASAGEDKKVLVRNLATGQVKFTLASYTHAVSGLAFSPDSQRLVTASWDNTVRVWDMATGAQIHSGKEHTLEVWSVACSPDGQRIASASNDRTVKIWDAASGRLLRTLRGHADRVSGVAFSPDGRRLASAGWDGTARLWDVASGQETLTLKTTSRRIFGVAFSPDGYQLAGATMEGPIILWDATPREP